MPTPVAEFVADKLSGLAPLAVTFADQSSNIPTSWAWTFGDGGVSTLQNPVHTYTTDGKRTVTLVATNALGSDTETKLYYVVIGPNPGTGGWFAQVGFPIEFGHGLEDIDP